jgi:hypothetical protein
MSDGIDRVASATGLKVGVSDQLRLFFELAANEVFVRQHNERLARAWDKSKPDHRQVVYSLFNVVVEDLPPMLKIFGSLALHHQFWFQAEKELEYWAIKYMGRRVSADFYVRHYAGSERWVFVERKMISVDLPKPPAAIAAEMPKP